MGDILVFGSIVVGIAMLFWLFARSIGRAQAQKGRVGNPDSSDPGGFYTDIADHGPTGGDHGPGP
jgi:hypothetical protein